MNYASILKRTDIFYDLNEEKLVLLAETCHEVHFGMGEMVFHEHSATDDLYIIAQGAIEILVDPSIIEADAGSSELVTITTMRAGQAFGEIALVDQGLRSAGARSAADDTRLLVLPRAKLLDLCEKHPELGYRVMRNLAAELALKLRGLDLAIREQLLWGGRRAQS
jgi:CRP/FNR family cyclic AMP-dependent transcriptional regulator